MNGVVAPPSHVNRMLPPVLDYILARALKKNPEERYGSAAEFAADLRDAIPDVLEAEAAARLAAAETGERTVPEGEGTLLAPRVAQSRDQGDPVLELRPSSRFDCVEGLARLAVIYEGADTTHSRAGFTVPKGTRAPRLTWRIDLPFALVVIGYVAAAIVAAIIVLN